MCRINVLIEQIIKTKTNDESTRNNAHDGNN